MGGRVSSGTPRLSDAAIRAGWEAERVSMEKWLVEEKKFNPKHVKRMVDNYIDSMVLAKLPCPTRSGIEAACRTYILER